MKYYILAGLVFGLIETTGFAQQAPASAAPSSKATVPAAATTVSTNKTEVSQEYLVIGYLKSQNNTITIKSGPSGPAYSVADKNGKVVFENVTLEHLKAKAPELHDQIKSFVAGNSALLMMSIRQF